MRQQTRSPALAERERSQAETVLSMHQIRSSIPGIVKAIYKKRGESVKNLEPVFQIVDLSHLRAEGMIEVEYLPRLRKGMTVAVEPTVPEAPLQTLLGHLQEVTGGGRQRGQEPWIVSAGEDGTVRVWEPGLPQRAAACWTIPRRSAVSPVGPGRATGAGV